MWSVGAVFGRKFVMSNDHACLPSLRNLIGDRVDLSSEKTAAVNSVC